MVQRRTPNKIGFEALEQRRLLAADLGIDLSASIMISGSDQMQVAADPEQIAVPDDALDLPEPCHMDQASSPVSTAAADSTGDGEVIAGQPAIGQLDLADGSDGIFGTLDAGNPSQQMAFVAPADGTANVIISSSFDDADTVVEVRDSQGELVTSSTTEGLDGFQQISFDVTADESYEMTVATSEGGEGIFQVTVEFEATEPVEPIDLHVNEIGEDATKLELIENEATISGDLETSGDVDVFQFQATDDGEISLLMGEMTEGNQVQLAVTVHNSEGEEILAGSTNEFVELKFDVAAGQTYYVSISAGTDQTGSYNLHLQQTVAETKPLVVEPVDQHVDEIGVDATLLEPVDGYTYLRGELETGDDADAFRVIAETDGKTTVELDALSEDQLSQLNLAVFNDQGEMLVEGLANESLEISFDTLAGSEYHLLVDSQNDLAASWQFSLYSEFDDLDPPSGDLDPIESSSTMSLVDYSMGSLNNSLNNAILDQAMEDFCSLTEV